ncbi:hypothetical protein VPH35_026349 [Triticum aestivum]
MRNATPAANPSISFHCLPQVKVPPLDSDLPEAITYEVAGLSIPHLRGFLAGASSAVLIVDFFCSIVLDVAAELGVPGYYFFTSAAEALASNLYLPDLHARSAANFREMGEELVHVPGIPALPHFPKPLMDHDDAAYIWSLRVSPNLCRSKGIIVNTFRSPEPRAVDAIAAGLCTPPGLPTPPVYCIRPLIKSEDVGVKRSHKADQAGGHRPGSQRQEVPMGRAVPDLDALLPEGFLDRTKGTGLVVKSRAPQRDVLVHGAVDGFMTHCGWNSVLEAVIAGVAMLAWPLYAEQRMNRVFLEEELGLAVAVDGYDKEVVEADEVTAKVRWLMDSDSGRVLRERTTAAMRRAKEALGEDGESNLTLCRLVQGWMLGDMGEDAGSAEKR